MMCLTLNFYAQNFYYGSDGKVALEISEQKILIKFKANLNTDKQLQVLSKQKNYLDLESIQILSDSMISIAALNNSSKDDAEDEWLQCLREDNAVDYANYLLIDSDGTLLGVTDRILLKLKSADQESLLNQIIYDFQGVTTYTRSSVHELLFEIRVHKNRNAVALANEIHEYGIFDYCEPDFLELMKQLTTNDISAIIEE
ncbi:MAG: hypothetical protein AB8F94_20595 [Saprospiraceae bacterium]